MSKNLEGYACRLLKDLVGWFETILTTENSLFPWTLLAEPYGNEHVAWGWLFPFGTKYDTSKLCLFYEYYAGLYEFYYLTFACKDIFYWVNHKLLKHHNINRVVRQVY